MEEDAKTWEMETLNVFVWKIIVENTVNWVGDPYVPFWKVWFSSSLVLDRVQKPLSLV